MCLPDDTGWLVNRFPGTPEKPERPRGRVLPRRGPKGSSSAVSSGTPRNRAPAATLVSPVNLRILYSMKPPYTDKFLSQIRKFFRDIYEKIIYNIIKEQVSVLEIK